MNNYRLLLVILIGGWLQMHSARGEEAGMKHKPSSLVAGKFGRTFEHGKSTKSVIEAPVDAARLQLPLTVEFWSKLTSGGENNSLIAIGEKGLRGSWEIFVPRWDSGDLGFYARGSGPEAIQTPRKMDPSVWHYCALVLESNQVTFFIDGKQIQQTAWIPAPSSDLPGQTVMRLGSDGLRAAEALFDDLRISRGVRAISGGTDQPFAADEQTIGLWHFDELRNGDTLVDASANQLNARIVEAPRISLNEMDRRHFKPGPAPMDSPAEEVQLERCGTIRKDSKAVEIEGMRDSQHRLALDGAWRMVEGGEEKDRMERPWADAMAARVPGSTAWTLFEAGRMPDPTVGKNMAIAFEREQNDFYYAREFDAPKDLAAPRLVIDGICEEWSAWLNGKLLGTHKGKYIRREFALTNLRAKDNRLVIKVNGLRRTRFTDPYLSYGPPPNGDIDVGCAQGWHYVACPPHGIWRSIWLAGTPVTQIVEPFIAARNARQGLVDLALNLETGGKAVQGKLTIIVQPENFKGAAHGFTRNIDQATTRALRRYRFSIPDPRPWWPVGLGEPDLYRLILRFEPKDRGEAHVRETVFGLRTVENRPLPGGPLPGLYNWQFVINGEEVFLKGANWCWNDTFLNLPREKFERFLGLARQQNVQVLRAWGAGILEKETFYDVCDRNGIMVLQEFPGWGPMPIVEASWAQFIRDRRNHPSLIWYGGGNEIATPYGDMIDVIGRLTMELDGTRPFHRTDPYGGSVHDYGVFWGDNSFDHNINLARRETFIGEFGFQSMPNLESVMKYLPDDEKNLWPAPPDGSFAFHTPAFNRNAGYGRDISHIDHYVKMFLPCTGMRDCASMKDYVFASQLAQATALRHPLEVMRTRRGEATGLCYYKLTDVYPAASYSSIDWYGAPRMAHFFLADAYAPLLACASFKTLHPTSPKKIAEIVLLDDGGDLAGKKWHVLARAFDGATMKEVVRKNWDGADGAGKVKKLGDFSLPDGTAVPTPLFVVTDVSVQGGRSLRTFYWLNFEGKPGCLLQCPQTTLALKKSRRSVTVRNTGKVPAIGVNFIVPKISDSFRCGDDFFWLEAGESREIEVSRTEGLEGVTAWNAAKATVRTDRR